MTTPIQLPHFQQSAPGYCLPACARMVLAWLGLELSEAEIGQHLGTQEYGTPGSALQRLSALHLSVTYREWSVAQLLDALRAGQPVIVLVRTAFLDHWTQDVAHAVVVVGAVEDDVFWIHDPALPTGPLTVSWNGLLAAWTEFDHRGATITR